MAFQDKAFSALDGVVLGMGGDFDSLVSELRRVRRRHTAGQAEGQSRNLLTVSEMNRRITLALARSVIQELRMKHSGHDPRYSSGNTSYAYSPDQILVTERDIQGIIERSLSLMDDDDDYGQGNEEARPEDASPRRQSFSAVNLDSLSKGIRPRPSVALDPATTISVPKTLFSSSSKYHRKSSARDKTKERKQSMTATIISRRSVAEITWTKNGGHLGDISDSDDESVRPSSDSELASPVQSSAAGTPKGYLRQRRPTRGRDSIRDHLVSSSIIYHSPGKPPSQVTLKVGEIPSSSNASLPLQPRSQQQDYFNWAEPIVWMDADDDDEGRERERALSSGSYDHRIDACSGTHSRRQTLFNENELHRRWTTNRSILNPSSGPSKEVWLARRSTLASPSLTRDENLADIIALRERHRSVPGLGSTRGSRKASARSTLMDRMMSTGQRLIGGGALGYKRQRSDDFDDLDEDAEFWAMPPNNSPSAGAQRTTAHHAPVHGSSDKSRAAKLRKCERGSGRRHTCSEDGRPHICENDEDSSSRE